MKEPLSPARLKRLLTQDEKMRKIVVSWVACNLSPGYVYTRERLLDWAQMNVKVEVKQVLKVR